MSEKIYNIDTELINTLLKDFNIDILIKPIRNSTKFFWLSATNNLYAIKVPISFISQLQLSLSENPFSENDLHSLHPLADLFGESFLHLNTPTFSFYPKRGLITKDYAEFFIDYAPILIDELKDEEFYVGSIKVQISLSSPLFYLLNLRFEDDYSGEIKNLVTIKLKGTSLDSIEDDLYSALYYLSILFPSVYLDLPKIAEFPQEDFLEIDPDRGVNTKHFPRPTYPIVLRFFYHADLLQGQEAILHYYKVLEHFFDIAWQHRIVELVAESKGDVAVLAELLAKNQPHNEEEELRLVLRLVQSGTLWQTVSQVNFCEANVNALAKKIYKTRNEIAHGKSSNKLEIIVPNMLPSKEILEKQTIFRLVAKETLLKLGGIVL